LTSIHLRGGIQTVSQLLSLAIDGRDRKPAGHVMIHCGE